MNTELTDRIYQAILTRICKDDDGLSDTTCTWCGRDSWQLQTTTRIYRLEDRRVIPAVNLVCTNCGLLLTFDLKTLGFEDLDVVQGRIAG